jgi:hypothetical protein
MGETNAPHAVLIPRFQNTKTFGLIYIPSQRFNCTNVLNDSTVILGRKRKRPVVFDGTQSTRCLGITKVGTELVIRPMAAVGGEKKVPGVYFEDTTYDKLATGNKSRLKKQELNDDIAQTSVGILLRFLTMSILQWSWSRN